MIPNLAFVEHWKLLTRQNIAARKLWPWGYTIQRIIAASEPKPREADHILVASVAARFNAFYLPSPQGVFRLTTTLQDEDGTNFEDLCAIPDLAAGMLTNGPYAGSRCRTLAQMTQARVSPPPDHDSDVRPR